MDISTSRQYILKGIAIIGMMALHFWGNPQWITEANMYSGALPNRIYEVAGNFGNVCVSIFAFLTGYSFYIRKDKWESSRYRQKKIVKFLAEYWVYIFLFIIIGLLCGEKCPSFFMLLCNMVGLGVGVGTEYVCVPFAWYVSFYLSVILLYPLLKKVLNYKLPICLCFLVVFYCVIEWIYMRTQGGFPIIAEFFRKENAMVPVYAGYLFGRYEILDKLSYIKKNRRMGYYGLGVLTIAGVLVLRWWSPKVLLNFWGVIYTLILVGFVCMELPDKEDSKAGRLLYILGKYSMGMWFISGIFFMPTRKLQVVAYFPKYPLAILIWVVVITFTASFAITKSVHFIEAKTRLGIGI